MFHNRVGTKQQKAARVKNSLACKNGVENWTTGQHKLRTTTRMSLVPGTLAAFDHPSAHNQIRAI